MSHEGMGKKEHDFSVSVHVVCEMYVSSSNVGLGPDPRFHYIIFG